MYMYKGVKGLILSQGGLGRQNQISKWCLSYCCCPISLCSLFAWYSLAGNSRSCTRNDILNGVY